MKTKVYKIKFKYMVLFATLLLFDIYFVFFISHQFSIYKRMFSLLAFPFLFFLLVFISTRAIIINNDEIYLANVFFNKIKKDKRQVKWEDVDKVLHVAEKIFHVYPKVDPNELYKYNSKSAVVIAKIYSHYEEILYEVVKNAKNAEVDESVCRIVKEWEEKKEIR